MSEKCGDCGKPTPNSKYDLCKECNAKSKKPDLQIVLSYGTAKEAVGKYLVNFEVLISKENKNLAGKGVEIICSGKTMVSARTDVNGRASGDFRVSAKADEEVEVICNILGAETNTITRKVKMVSDPPKPSEVHKLDPRLLGGNGSYTLDIQLTFQNGPSRAIAVKVSEVLRRGWTTILTNGVSYQDTTGANGFLSIPLDPSGFKEEQRKIVVQVLETRMDYPIILDGPKREWKPKKIGKTIKGRWKSLWDNLGSISESKRRYSR